MGRKLGLTRRDLVAAAASIADADGFETVTLARVAADLGIRSPSLYNHVEGLPGLRRLLALHAAKRLAGMLRSAQREAADDREALHALAYAYRAFAHRHPGLYNALLPAPMAGEDPELERALTEPVAVVAAVLGRAAGDDAQGVHRARAFQALLHGFVSLEAGEGFGLPTDIEGSFAFAIDAMASALVD